MSQERNAHLHSGSVPFGNVRTELWQPNFWKSLKALLKVQGKQLSDIVSSEEVSRIESIITDAGTVLQTTVEARIQHFKRDFEQRNREAALRMRLINEVSVAARFHSKNETGAPCPSCSTLGILSGEEVDSSIDREGIDTDEAPFFTLTTTYESENFKCVLCGLKLNSKSELEAANLPLEFKNSENYEPSYEDEYQDE